MYLEVQDISAARPAPPPTRQSLAKAGDDPAKRRRVVGAAGLLDEMQIHLTPVILGRSVRLIDDLGGHEVRLEQTRVLEAPGVTHLRYHVLK